MLYTERDKVTKNEADWAFRSHEEMNEHKILFIERKGNLGELVVKATNLKAILLCIGLPLGTVVDFHKYSIVISVFSSEHSGSLSGRKLRDELEG